MGKKSNSEIEKYYFDRFRRIYPLPEGKIIYGDSPDIIIKGKKLIGVEITSLFLEDGNLPESEQVQRERREKVVSNAQKDYKKQNGRNCEIVFSFNNLKPILDEKKLKVKLINLAKNMEGFETGEIERETFKEIPELSFVYLNSEQHFENSWRVQQVYEINNMSRNRLIKLVKKKEKKINTYKKCDAYWLLVVIDFIDFAQDQEVGISNFKKIDTEFEKVIVYKTIFDHVLEAK